jgi:hypothetical protein
MRALIQKYMIFGPNEIGFNGEKTNNQEWYTSYIRHKWDSREVQTCYLNTRVDRYSLFLKPTRTILSYTENIEKQTLVLCLVTNYTGKATVGVAITNDTGKTTEIRIATANLISVVENKDPTTSGAAFTYDLSSLLGSTHNETNDVLDDPKGVASWRSVKFFASALDKDDKVDPNKDITVKEVGIFTRITRTAFQLQRPTSVWPPNSVPGFDKAQIEKYQKLFSGSVWPRETFSYLALTQNLKKDLHSTERNSYLVEISSWTNPNQPVDLGLYSTRYASPDPLMSNDKTGLPADPFN